MPVKILLADKSITIQKVVEMLFSGKDYEVVCVSDGETALSEAARVAPGRRACRYRPSPRRRVLPSRARLKQVPALAQTPVILMMSRDDVFDQAKAQAGVDRRPYRKALRVAGADRQGQEGGRRHLPGLPQPQRAAPQPSGPGAKPAAPHSRSRRRRSRQNRPPPTDIFDIIEEAPARRMSNGIGCGAEDEDASTKWSRWSKWKSSCPARRRSPACRREGRGGNAGRPRSRREEQTTGPGDRQLRIAGHGDGRAAPGNTCRPAAGRSPSRSPAMEAAGCLPRRLR